jgi:glycosyltransferase involved in cell wall biosynthesis
MPDHTPLPVSESDQTLGEQRTAAHIPKVTVGLAVYNGEKFLDQALRSIVSQTFDDFELVISDNCSTDSTPEICARHAAVDERIRYFRNPVNIGGVRNENRTLFLARGEYFKLAAHDDLVDPTFLARCVEVLDARPDIDVCSTGVQTIDDSGAVTGSRASLAGTESAPSRRMAAISHREYACEATYGVMRTSALREVRPQTNHLHSDRIVLCELAMRGPFHVIEEPLFFKRHHNDNMYRDWRGRMAWYQPELKASGAIRMPHLLQTADYLAMLGRARLGVVDRIRCLGTLAWWCWHMRRSFAMDAYDATRMLIKGREARRRRYSDESSWR